MSFGFFPPSGAYAYGGGPLEGPPPLYNPLYPPRRGFYPYFRRGWRYHYKPRWWDGRTKTALWYYY